jgi:hypothetical protein
MKELSLVLPILTVLSDDIFEREQYYIDPSDDNEESVEYMMGEWKHTWEIKGVSPNI